jgi:hypothetical protein
VRISIESTGHVLELDGVPVREWRGRTEGGIEVLVFVHRVAVPDDADCAAFDRELRETMVPGSVAVTRQPR